MIKEIDYYNKGTIFIMEIECTLCGSDDIMLSFNDMNNTLIFKCICGHEEIASI